MKSRTKFGSGSYFRNAMFIQKRDSDLATASEWVILGLSACVTLCTLCWILWYAHFGFDFTDESFYLVWLANPFNYDISITQFGFVYHLLYQLLDGRIAALRQANILITFGLAWCLASVFLQEVFGRSSMNCLQRLVITAAVATSATTSIVFAGMWLPTPSYNSLTLQGMLVCAIGLILAKKSITRASLFGWFLIGAGGWLVFMAKPPSASVLSLLAICYLTVSNKLNLRLIAVALFASVSLLVLSALYIDGSIHDFVERMKGGFELTILLGGHSVQSLFRLEELQLNEKTKDLLNLIVFITFLFTYFVSVDRKMLKTIGFSFFATLSILSLAIVFGFIRKPLDGIQFPGLILCAPLGATILLGFSKYIFGGGAKIPLAHLFLALMFMLLPYIYAFGTNGNYWILIACAGIFCVLSGLVFLSPMVLHPGFPGILLSICLLIQLVSVAIIQTGIESPYRQPKSLRDDHWKVELRTRGNTIILPENFAHYIKDASKIAAQAQFKMGTPVIDLSGETPGILYAIGASNIGLPWLLGGYPGSNAFAIKAFEKPNCSDLAQAWILLEPSGQRRISTDVLASIGANAEMDFQLAGIFRLENDIGGKKEIRIQQLLRPTRPIGVGMAACSASRAEKGI